MALPPKAPTLADRVSRPFQRFLDIEIASAVVLLAMAVAALLWANSPLGATYDHFWHTHLGISVGTFHLELSLAHFVNDALMAIFFFVVGLEIKRELVQGELSTRQKAMLPIAAALGGMIVPALIYTSFHAGGPASHGWGIPMATDIAFAVAAMSALGSRVPTGLKVFLLALAIADDLGAVAVIAIFYTSELSLVHLGGAVLGLFAVYGLRVAGVRSFGIYWVVGIAVWYLTFRSGVHATVAGVALGFLTPTNSDASDHETLMDHARHTLDRLREIVHLGNDHHGEQRHRVLADLHGAGLATMSPLDFLVNELDRLVAFFIMPVFALANAGVVIDASTLGDPMTERVAIAVSLGLVVGKPIGIALFSFVAVKTGLAALPRGVNWQAILATGFLAGIGFTVALFVTNLAFDEPLYTSGSKIGILSGSLIATLLGLFLLARSLKPDTNRAAEAPPDTSSSAAR